MNKLLSVLLFAATAILMSCAGSKAKAQEQVLDCDLIFEYHAIENDSISLFIGNTFRLHTGKANPGRFYPLLVSVRNPRDLDRPTSTEIVSDDAGLLLLLRKNIPLLTTIGVVIDDNTSKAKGFTQAGALTPIFQLAKLIPGSRILVFHEKSGDLVRVETAKDPDASSGTMPHPAQTGL